jgi:glycosyltransferase involved in cell wall biosynthesis
MRAMAASMRLRKAGVYRLIGPVEEKHRNQLKQFAAHLGLAPPEFHGWVRNEELFRLLAQSHAICCLRYPVTEGGSASLITALYTARPVVVADVASYSLVPDYAVWKVEYGETVDDLSRVLDSIEVDPEGANRRARLAREWAKHQYSASAYVQALLPILHAAVERVPALEAGRQIGRELALMGMSLDDPAALRIGTMIGQLFDSGFGQRA